jgi:hypothetical protein
MVGWIWGLYGLIHMQLFKDVVPLSLTIQHKISDYYLIMNWKGWGRKRSRLNLRYHRGICLQALRKIKVRFKLAGFLAKSWIQYFLTRSKNAATTFCGLVLQRFSVGISRDRIIQYNANTTGGDFKMGLKHVRFEDATRRNLVLVILHFWVLLPEC